MNARVGLVGIVLHGCFQGSRGGRSEDGAMAGMVIKGIAVNPVRRLFGGEEEYGTGVGGWG